MKKIIIISILIFTGTLFAKCQDLLIRYDLVNNNIYYFKIKKNKGIKKLIPLKNPRIGANRSVKVEYVNINPFIWNQPRLNLVSVTQDSVSSFNPFTMLLPSSISEKFGPLSLGLSRDASTTDPQTLMCESALHSLYNAYEEVDALKYNYKLTKQQILDQSKMKIQNVMKTCYSATHIDTSAADLKKKDFESLRNYFNNICQINIPDATRSATDSKVNSFLGNAGINSRKDIMPKEAVNQIEQNYYTVSDADFSFDNSFIVNEKDVVLHMNFSLTNEYQKKSSKDSAFVDMSSKHPQKVKDESIFIPVSGGVEFSSSAGIGFTYLGPARKTYYLENDSVLSSAVDNRIVPVVGSFLNVYSRRLGVVNVGGSFGLSVALQETLSINYMFGLSTVIGRKGKILISGGLVLSPVSEPSKGYYIGMHTTNPDFPTKMNYKPGIFFFVHYNIGKF